MLSALGRQLSVLQRHIRRLEDEQKRGDSMAPMLLASDIGELRAIAEIVMDMQGREAFMTRELRKAEHECRDVIRDLVRFHDMPDRDLTPEVKKLKLAAWDRARSLQKANAAGDVVPDV